MADKLAIVFDGPPANESGRFIEVELNGAGVSFGEWQENGDYWELVLPDPYALLAKLKAKEKTLEAKLEAMERLGNYVAHQVTCELVESGGECDCGLGEILAIA